MISGGKKPEPWKKPMVLKNKNMFFLFFLFLFFYVFMVLWFYGF